MAQDISDTAEDSFNSHVTLDVVKERKCAAEYGKTCRFGCLLGLQPPVPFVVSAIVHSLLSRRQPLSATLKTSSVGVFAWQFPAYVCCVSL
jgi:hypothetical protein